MKLSVAIIARDEARHIGACLASVAALTDDVLVLLDSRTRDRTEEICRLYGAAVVLEPWRGFAAQRNRALWLCKGEWVLLIDADERVTPAMAQEIPARISAAGDIAGYGIPRYNLFFGQALRGGGWYPDYQMRLLRRTHAHYDEQTQVHESAHLDGVPGYLDGHMLHHNIESLGEFWHKQSGYALAEARTLYLAGRRARWRNFPGAPLREFWRRYVLLSGWRDGLLGLFLCGSLAWFEVVKFGCLRLLQKDGENRQPPRRAG
jgi:glycosyltransferase involved in cell wall biosynthesis